MFPIYRFKLNGSQVAPKYNSGLALEYAQESSQKFYRTSLSGSLTFTESDYDAIMSQPFDFEHVLTIETLQNKVWALVWTGSFYRTDCTINIEDKKIEVKPTVKDEYVDIINGLDKEFNLVELKPAIENVNLRKRPLIQIYQPGESVVSCFIGGLYWEQDCDIVESANELTDNYGFAKIMDYAYIQVVRFPVGVIPDISGIYTRSFSVGGLITLEWLREDGEYKIIYFPTAGYQVYRSGESKAFAKSDESGYNIFTIDGNAQLGFIAGAEESVRIYARLLLDKIPDDKEYVDISKGDIVENNRNYKYAAKYTMLNEQIEISDELSESTTEWGIYQPGQYYVRPNKSGYENYPAYPIARTKWSKRSFWFRPYPNDMDDSIKYAKDYTIRDAYTLGAAIKALLAEIAPSLTHEETAEYSQFLYGDKMADIQKLMICQKTNLINGEYQQPAQKATIKLSDITDLLAKAFKCYWYIEDNKFKIEHIRFFDNGGGYDSSAKVDTSLLLLTSKKNTKAWGFKTSTYKFDKVNMPESYTFAWMDDTTVPFESSGLKVLSNYVEKSKIEEVTVSAFTTDVDYMLLNPSAISNDGFALFGVDDTNTVSMVDTIIDNVRYILQNGYLAFASLLTKYYLYDLPAKKCKINGNEYEALSVAKNKKQEDVKFPISAASWPNVFGLYQTKVGLGQIEKATVNLDTKIVNATLKYPTE